LSADSSLRRVTSELSRNVTTTFGSGSQNTLASIGLKLNNDGTLRLDRATLDAALATDPSGVAQLLAGDNSTGGAMDRLAELSKSLTAPDTGVVDIRKDALQASAKRYDDRVAREEARLVTMEERLRKTFTEMDSTVGAYQAQLQSLLTRL
jgi:flagellar hook-associated protein 2